MGPKNNSVVSLRFPDGTKERDEASIKEALSELLVHGKGTYDQVVFSSQRHPFASLPTVLNLQGANNDLLTSLSQAVLETGGMSLKEFQEKLDQKADSLQKRWDVAQDLPERKPGGGRYAVKEGDPSILAAYYALQDARDELKNASELEKNYEQKAAYINQLDKEKREAQAKIDAFDQSRSALDTRKSLRAGQGNAQKAVDIAQEAYSLAANQEKVAGENLDAARKDFEVWPCKQKDADKFAGLFAEREAAEKLVVLQKRLGVLKGLQADLAEKAAACKEEAPSAGDVRLASQLQRKMESAKSKLSGINLSALLELENGAFINVIRLSDGAEIPVRDGKFDITESVNIVVPGVMSLQLAPKDVDAKALSNEIAESTQALDALFVKFGVTDVDALDKLQRSFTQAQSAYQTAKSRFEVKLGDDSLEDLEAEAARLEAETRALSEIDAALELIANGKDPQAEYQSISRSLAVLEVKYGSVEDLSEKLEEFEQAVAEAEKKTADAQAALETKQADLAHADEDLAQAPEVDAQYDGIEDLDTYRETLETAKTKCDTELGDAREELGKLGNLLENSSEEDAQTLVEECEKELARRKEGLQRWLHIKEVLDEVLEDAGGNPMKEIEKSFKSYLSEMTDGQLDSGEMAENLGVEVKSGTHPLKWDIASDGTKDVLELALRLAILDQMFPGGGGMVVLDDPFTDMDPKRTSKACSMVERFAEHNQVIFLTCDPKYKEQFGDAKKVIEW